MSHYKPYPVYKDSGVEWLGRVPEHWDIRSVKTLARLDGGAGFPDDEQGQSDNPIPFFKVAELASGLRDTANTVTEETAKRLGAKIFPPSTLVFAKVGAALLLNRRCLLEMPACLDNNMMALLPGPYDSQWFFWVFCTLDMGLIANPGAVPSINQEQVGNIRLGVPTLAEQKSIAQSLRRETDRIDALIEKKTRFINLLREKRQALITHAVTKGLDPSVKMKDSGVEWLGEVPEHWEVLQLRHTARLESGHTPSRSKPEYWVDCTVPWFTLADVWQVRSGEQKYVFETSEMVSQLGLENSSARLLPAGSVFLSRTASVGFTGIMAVDMATSQDFAVWTCTSELFNEYLYYVLLGMKPDFDRLMMGSTHKTIYMPDIEAIRIARPPVDEQRGIVSVLSGQLGRFKSVIDKTERSIELLKERRSALITAAVTGQIDLREVV